MIRNEGNGATPATRTGWREQAGRDVRACRRSGTHRSEPDPRPAGGSAGRGLPAHAGARPESGIYVTDRARAGPGSERCVPERLQGAKGQALDVAVAVQGVEAAQEQVRI